MEERKKGGRTEGKEGGEVEKALKITRYKREEVRRIEGRLRKVRGREEMRVNCTYSV